MFNKASIAGFVCNSILACITLMLAMPPALAFSAEREIAWTENYEAAVQRAASTNSVLLLHFYGDYCPPCKLLDKKTFRDPSLVAAINENVVAVRINAEKRRDLASKYNVNRWPTDVYLYSNGDELYRGISDQDPAAYTKKIQRIALRHRDWSLERESVAKNTQRGKVNASVANAPQSQPEKSVYASATFRPTHGQAASAPENSEVHRSTQSALAPVALAASPKPARVINNPYLAHQPIVVPAASPHVNAETVGLEGYCPVTLADSIGRTKDSTWVRGSASYAVRHRGRVYHCASEQARQALLTDPDRYTPCLSGFDLVHFLKTGLLVDGKCEFSCIQAKSNKVYLFADVANYREFERDNERFSSLLEGVTPERDAERSSESQNR